MLKSIRHFISGFLVVAVALVTMPAHAGMIGTEQLATAETREVSLLKVQDFMSRAEVQQQFQAWGVAPEMAAERVAALTDVELQQLALNIDQQPAGGDALVVVGIVFVVLLILELVGVTNVFTKF